MTVAFVFGTLRRQVLVPYHRYVYFLKWLTLSLLAYAAVLFTVHVPWGEVALRTFWPQLTLNSGTAAVVVGVFGTTISPYLFFWQASEEVEDMHARSNAAPLNRDAPAAAGELRRILWDTWSGMLFSDLAAFCIILATGVTLHTAGITDINTAAQAASALPDRGEFRLSALRPRDSGRWVDRGSGAGGVGRLCALRGDGLEMGTGTQGHGRAGVLRRDRRERAGRDVYPVFADQSDEGVVLERGDQRGCGGTTNGCHYPAGFEEVGDGGVYGKPTDHCVGLDCDGGDGRGGGLDVPAGIEVFARCPIGSIWVRLGSTGFDWGPAGINLGSNLLSGPFFQSDSGFV